MFYFDIETGPLPEDKLMAMMPPYLIPDRPGPFDPSAVKCGNLGPEKSREKIDKARADHAQSVADYDRAVSAGLEKHKSDFISKAALSPLTGQVLAIGYGDGSGIKVITSDFEAGTLQTFWALLKRAIGTGAAGWAIHGFDLPFLIRRSWFHGLTVPPLLTNSRYWDNRLIDMMVVFSCGQYGASVKLNDAARFFGVGEKTGDGADFARFYNGTPAERKQAIDYLKNDVALTIKVGEKMML